MAASGAGVPLPPPARAMTFAMDMIGGNDIALGGGGAGNDGVDSESQITDVRKGVAKWESLG